MKIKFMVMLLVIASIASVAYFFGKSYRDKKLGNDIKIYGNVEINEVNIGFLVDVGRIHRLYFNEGDIVKAGDLLGEIDNRSQTAIVALNEASLKAAESKLEKLKNGTRIEDIEEGKARFEEAKANFDYKDKHFKRMKQLYSSQSISENDYDISLSEREVALSRLKVAEASLNRLNKGPRSEDIRLGEAELDAAKNNLKLALKNFEDTKLFAVSSGVITVRAAEEGEIVTAGNTIYIMSLDETLYVRGYLSELDLGRVRIGDEAFIYNDTYKHEPHEGIISYISPTAEFTPKHVQTEDIRSNLVYRIKVAVTNPDGVSDVLKQGMPVTVVIPKP